MRIVLLGPPGAGKGTLAGLLKESLKIAHISTGDMLREEMQKQSELGKDIKRLVESGALVADEIVTKLIENKMNNDPNVSRGFMLDGFPRTKHQAEDLDRLLIKIKKPLDFTLYMESSLPVIIQRLAGRRVCKKCGAPFHVSNRPPKKGGICDACGGALYQRADDNEETIKNRMKVYLENTTPVLDYYRRQNKLRTLNADQDAEHVYAHLLEFLHEDEKIHKNQDG